MATRSNKRKDFSQIAFDVVQQATGEAITEPKLTGRKANSRAGGLKGGKSRAENLTPEQRTEIARNAAKTRWK